MKQFYQIKDVTVCNSYHETRLPPLPPLSLHATSSSTAHAQCSRTSMRTSILTRRHMRMRPLLALTKTLAYEHV